MATSNDANSADTDLALRQRIVIGIFERPGPVDAVVDELLRRGWTREMIDVVYRPDGKGPHEAAEDTKAMTGAATGAVGGAALGGLAGLLVGAAGILAPGIGSVLAIGPVAAALGGAGMGAAMGGLAGAFAGLGVPDEHAREYEAAVREGGIFVSVRARDGDEAAAVRDLFESHGARSATDYNAKL